MTKPTKTPAKTEPKAPLVMVSDRVTSGVLKAVANPDVPTAPSGAAYTIERGRTDAEKWCYQTSIILETGQDAISGEITGSVSSANNSALAACGLVKGALGLVTSLKDLFPAPVGDNKPPAYELTEDDTSFANDMVTETGEALEELANAEVRGRAAHMKTAKAVSAIRTRFADKAKWAVVYSAVLRNAPDPVAELLSNRNNVSTYHRFALMGDYDFFDMLPDDLKTPRSVEKVVGQMRVGLANAVVKAIFTEKKITIDGKRRFERSDSDGKPVSLLKMGTDMAVLTVLREHLAEGGEHLDVDLSEPLPVVAHSMCKVHMDNIEGHDFDGAIFVTGEKGISVNADAANGLFGFEGRDELLNAIAKAFNNYEATRATQKAADETGDAVKALAGEINAGNPFSGFEVNKAAAHLMGILAAKADDKKVAESADELRAVVDRMSLLVEGFANGELSKADLVNSIEAQAADEAEDEADEV